MLSPRAQGGQARIGRGSCGAVRSLRRRTFSPSPRTKIVHKYNVLYTGRAGREREVISSVHPSSAEPGRALRPRLFPCREQLRLPSSRQGQGSERLGTCRGSGRRARRGG
eukprot:scaffold9913_cov141-Isochrysis_galbana.AAC.3